MGVQFTPGLQNEAYDQPGTLRREGKKPRIVLCEAS